MLVPALQEIQARYGYLPESELTFLAQRAGVPLYRVQEVATFFPHFRLRPPPQVVVHICRSMTCHLRGAGNLLDAARARFAPQINAGTLAVEGVSCLGRCDRAPIVCLSRHGEQSFHDYLYASVGHGGPARELDALVAQALDPSKPSSPPDLDRPEGTPSPRWQINPYHPQHGDPRPAPFAVVKQFLQGGKPDDVIKALNTAGLVGMGGAAARTGKKWQDVMRAAAEVKYVVCNGDESEPGTFKDRELLLHAPHLVVEGMLIAGLTLNAQKGYVYIRHEYPEQIEAVKRAIGAAQEHVPEALERCPLEVFVSPGAYICGEESALLEVIEGRRAQPRNTPPEIRTNGLYDKPTLVNNVETFAWVPVILLKKEGEWYRQAGLRFFSISGHVRRPGVYEVPITTTLGQLVNEQAGGMVEGFAFKAVATSGPSGGFLPRYLNADEVRQTLHRNLGELRKREPAAADRVERFRQRALAEQVSQLDVLELELDVALFRTLELALGAGIVVYGEKSGARTDMLEHALNCLEFFEKESCGKCVPCRLGCQELVKFAQDLRQKPAADGPTRVEPAVRTLAQVMEVTSICGLGRAAANPFLTVLDHFREELTDSPPASEAQP